MAKKIKSNWTTHIISLLVSLIFIHLLQSLYLNEKKNRLFLITLILIVLFDILILGFFFGSEKLLERYSFLNQEIKQYSTSAEVSLSRGDLAQFAYIEFKKFIFFLFPSIRMPLKE